MSGGSSSTPSKIKVGRKWGYPIIVTIGKSTHEAILLDCNSDDPQEFLNKQIDVNIRWKVAGYNDTVPASNVELQNVDTLYYLPRKAALAAASAAQGPPAKKRKAEATKLSSTVRSSGIKVKEEEIETDNDEDNEKPAAVPSSVNIKEEEIETDNEEDNEKPAAVPSSINVKEEEVETDDEELDSAVIASGIKMEDIETDDEEDTKQPTTTDLKIEEVEKDDDDRKSHAENKNGRDTFKETDNEMDLVDLTAADDKDEEEKEVDMVDLTVTDEEDSRGELSASFEPSPRAAAAATRTPRRINWAELGLDDSSDEEMGGEEVTAAGDKRKGVDDEQQDKDTDEDGVDTDEDDEDSDEEEVYGEDTDDKEDEQESNKKNKEDMPKIPILTEEEKRVVLIQYRKDHPEVEDSNVETILSEYCKFMYIKIKNGGDCTPSPMVADMWVSICDICSSFYILQSDDIPLTHYISMKVCSYPLNT